MSNTIVQFEHVSKRYLRQRAVEDLNFELPQGKIIGLIGPNGSGKSTVLKLMAGLLRPSTGTITVQGVPVQRQISELVSYSSDRDVLYSFFTVAEMIEFYQGVFPDFDRERALKMIRFLELSPGQRVKSLSKGNLGRLKIALTLSRRAPLILMDEPLSGLDPLVRKSIIASLISFVDLESQTVVLSTHEVTEMEPMLDMAVLIQNGKVRDIQEVAQIQEQYAKGMVGWMEANWGRSESHE